jgi:hypothetical protein
MKERAPKPEKKEGKERQRRTGVVGKRRRKRENECGNKFVVPPPPPPQMLSLCLPVPLSHIQINPDPQTPPTHQGICKDKGILPLEVKLSSITARFVPFLYHLHYYY